MSDFIDFNWSKWYSERVLPNIGIITIEEQEKLRQSSVAIAGCGSIGAEVAEKLAYFGIGKLHLSDPERVETRNANRQLCASFSTIGKRKVDVVAKRVKDISPDIKLKLYPSGINKHNVYKFLWNSHIRFKPAPDLRSQIF